jgi:hypothetical protein
MAGEKHVGDATPVFGVLNLFTREQDLLARERRQMVEMQQAEEESSSRNFLLCPSFRGNMTHGVGLSLG